MSTHRPDPRSEPADAGAAGAANGDALPDAAYQRVDADRFRASALTRGPWHPQHQHAGPPIALVCAAIQAQAQSHGLTQLARLTANLLRPVPIGELAVQVSAEHVGRTAGHFSARLLAEGRELGRFTALLQRPVEAGLPDPLPGQPVEPAPPPPQDCPPAVFPFARSDRLGYADLVETRQAEGQVWRGPCAVWFRLRHPLVAGEATGAVQRVLVAADSGNGISAVLDTRRHSFANADLSVHLLREPVGEWICLRARTALGPAGSGLAESALFDAQGFLGRSVQSLAVRPVAG